MVARDFHAILVAYKAAFKALSEKSVGTSIFCIREKGWLRLKITVEASAGNDIYQDKV